MANREDIVTSSQRNMDLLDGIADAFIKAVRQMYDDETLRYRWMRYLDNMKSYPWDPFWQKLVDKIDGKVTTAEILQPRRRGSARLIEDLRRLPSSMSDEDGIPLFKDLQGRLEIYISTEYQSSDLKILEEYGLEHMTQAQVLKRVEQDLCEPDSRMKNTTPSDDWHTHAAAAIQRSFDKRWEKRIAETRGLRILPLSDGTWVSANTCQVIFPETDDGITIPGDVGLSILAPSACENEVRVELFASLGAEHAVVDDVRSRVLGKYRKNRIPSPFNLETSHSHLTFLYRTHQPEYSSQYKHLRLYDTESRLTSPRAADCYFVSEDPYSMWQLSRQGQDEWFKSNVSFFDPRYFQHPPPKGSTDQSWEKWFQSLGVQERPNLVSRDKSSLSLACLHIANELPSKFLGFLQYAWEESREDMLASSEDIMEALRDLEVLCQGDDTFVKLSDTYLPLPILQEKCSPFMDDNFFPFLELGESWPSDEEVDNWRFLKRHLGVGAEDNLQFYIDMLSWMWAASEGNQIANPLRILEVYTHIHSRCVEARDRPAARGLVQ